MGVSCSGRLEEITTVVKIKYNNSGWWLVLIIWGNKYPDSLCNQLIHSAYRHSKKCAGVLVLSDRLDRDIDKRACVELIPDTFNNQKLKQGGLPVKICLFDLPIVPVGCPCIYIDLDSSIIGNLDKLISLLNVAPIWTIDAFMQRFSFFWRLLYRLTNGKKFAVGNSSVFVFKNGFKGNPTTKFKHMWAADTIPQELLNDDVFVAWSCQEIIRGLPTHWVVNCRKEFFAHFMWINYVSALIRRSRRQHISVVTFAGENNKLEAFMMLQENAVLTGHHGKVGRWNTFFTSGVSDKVMLEKQSIYQSQKQRD